MNFYDHYTDALEKVAKNVPTSPEKWARAKAQARAKFDVYPCVPLDSLAITRSGPTHYRDLAVGVEILTYSIENDQLEWQPIEHLHYYEDAPLIEIGKSTGFKVRCTPNHKWVARTTKDQPYKLVEAQNITKHMLLKCASELPEGDMTKLGAWSKKDSWAEQVLAWSPEAREVYLASAIVYDGHDQGLSTRIEGRHTFGFSQKEYDHLWAALLAAAVNGYHVTFRDKGDTGLTSATLIRNKQEHSTQNLIKRDAGSEDVWCPTTANNTWVMVQNGFITITGNSAYANGWAAKKYKAMGGGWKKEAELNKEAFLPLIGKALTAGRALMATKKAKTALKAANTASNVATGVSAVKSVASSKPKPVPAPPSAG